jgi:dihydropteroate synthase
MIFTSPLIWRCGSRSLELGKKPCIMGVLNVTPDSFSDGGKFNGLEQAVERALAMEEEGADIIDVGGESTRPFAGSLSESEELRRVIPVIESLSGHLKIPISIDTYKSVVARESLAAGAEIVNDISALSFDPEMTGVVSCSGAGVVLMHTRGRPADMQRDTSYQDLVPEILSFFGDTLSKADAAGIESDRIVLDPGIGFGKDVHGNLEILRRLDEFASLGRPILVGSSRKSFIGEVLEKQVADRLFGTAASVAAAILNGASIVRVHDISAMRDVAMMTYAIRDGLDP